MGDLRYSPFYARVRDAQNPATELRKLGDEDVIAALAAASQASDPYLANVLATEAQNRALWKSRIIASMGDAVFIVSMPDRKILHANPAAERMFGYPADELLGESTRILHVDDEHYDTHGKRIQDALRTGSPLHAEFELRRRNGEIFPTEHTVSFITNEWGEVKGRVSLIRDVTERKRAQDLLGAQKRALEEMVVHTMKEVRRRRKAEEEFRGLLEAAPDAILISEEGGRIVLANAQAERIFGYDHDEIERRGLTVEDLMPERFRGTHAGHRVAYRADLHVRPMGAGLDLYARRKDGTEFPVEISLSPIETEDGTLLAAAIRDVTDKKRAERALQEAHERLHAAFEACPEPMMAVDPEGRVTLWNPAAERVFGWTAKEVTGRTNPLVAREDWEAYTNLLRRVLGGETLSGVELERIRRDGTPLPTRLSAAPIRDAEGRAVGVMTVVSDVTERLRAKEELQELRRDLQRRVADRTRALEAANQELESFSYSVSHDLRAPLRAIDYFSQALEEDHARILDGEGRDFLRRVREGTQRMTQQINDLLELSRVTRGELRRERVALTDLAHEVIEEVRRQAPDRHVEWVVAKGLVATADPRLLRLVVQNLLGNAWKYTSKLPGARVEFGADAQNGIEAFFVRDNGVGFHPADAHKIFAPFQRLHPEGEFEGTGVGLATVKRIIERHGGRVWAEGRPDEGATFWFTL